MIVHFLIGFRRLRDVDYYRDDPLVKRLLGLERLPDVSTISRALYEIDIEGADKLRGLSRGLVIDGIQREGLKRLTLDFDGSVLSTQKHAEGTSVGFNPRRRGARSYYPLFCTVAQTGQFFDLLHRSGNVHDSNGAAEFMMECFDEVWKRFPDAVFESRLDAAFFERNILSVLDASGIEFTATVPFARMPELKRMIEGCRRWHKLDSESCYFETDWKPHSWGVRYRFIFVRKRVRQRRRGPLQLDLFEPLDFDYQYKVIVTNKRQRAGHVAKFHNGRGSQEAIFGDAKQDTGFGDVHTYGLQGNKVLTLCSMMAHNISREVQILSKSRVRSCSPKRSALWNFETLDTLRHRIIQRAGRLVRPQGHITLTMNINPSVAKDLRLFLEAITQQT